MNEALEAALKRYMDTFDDSFPSFQLMNGRTDDEVIKMIDECIAENKDVYDMGFLKDDDLIY